MHNARKILRGEGVLAFLQSDVASQTKKKL